MSKLQRLNAALCLVLLFGVNTAFAGDLECPVAPPPPSPPSAVAQQQPQALSDATMQTSDVQLIQNADSPMSSAGIYADIVARAMNMLF